MKWIVLFLFVMLVIFTQIYIVSSSSDKRTLRVMTYSSFAGVFGPGDALKKIFEENCFCRVKWIKVPDSTLFIQRLSLRPDGFKTDVVMGLDQLSLRKAKQLQWKLANKSPPDLSIFTLLKGVSKDIGTIFIPYNWSPMTFLSRVPLPRLLLQDLLHEKYRHNISLPAPHTSTVGLQFLYWIWSVFQQDTEQFLVKFKNQLYGLPSSWSTSYALFQRGHVDLSFSYLSSLLYHLQQQQKDFYPVLFQKGHPFQVELAAISGFCVECELARQWVHFLLTPPVQKILFQKNYMFPVIKVSMGNQTDRLLSGVELISYDHLDLFLDQKDKWLKQWK